MAFFRVSSACPVSVLIGIFLEPLRPVCSFRGQQRFEIDGRRCAVRFLGLEGNGASLGDFQVETHHRFVNAADLLDVERPVAEAFTVEDQEIIEDAEDHAVGDAGNTDVAVVMSASGLPRAAFEEVVAVGIEQIAVPWRDFEFAVAAAFVNQPEQREELCPGPVPLIHRVRIPAIIGPQAARTSP